MREVEGARPLDVVFYARHSTWRMLGIDICHVAGVARTVNFGGQEFRCEN